MAQRIARAVTFQPAFDTAAAMAGIARFAIVAGSAAALILAGPYFPF